MQTFSMFFSEEAGDKFKAMSDDQFENWKKNNPGAAAMADRMRKDAKGSAIVKAGTPTNNYKKVLADKAKKIAADKAKQLASKAGGALVKKGKETIANKIRKKDMGKWSQGIKNSPKKLKAGEKGGDLVPSAQRSASGSAGIPELEGQKAKDAKARKEAGKYRKMRDAVSGGMRDYDKEKEAREQAKKDAEDNMTVKQRLKDRFDNSYLGKKGGKKRGDAIYDAPGKLASFIARNMRSSVRGDDRVSYGSDLGPV